MTIKNTKKVLTTLLFVFTFTLTGTFFTSYKASAAVISGFDFKCGDIMVTSSTRSKGLTGHAGLVLPDGENIVHIAGPHQHASKISISQWLTNYPATKVVRSNDRLTAFGASCGGRNYFLNGAGRDIDYLITPGITSKSKMYCSKLVWQCYDMAGLQFRQADMNIVTFKYMYRIPSIIGPYDFIDDAALEYNGFSIVKSFNW